MHAIAGLISGLEHANWGVRLQSAHSLGAVGKNSPDAMNALIKTTKDVDGRVRNEAITALGHLGEKAIPVLEELSKEKLTRERATTVLEQVQSLYGIKPAR